MPILPFIEKIVDIPDGVTAKIDNNILVVKGPKGELTREFKNRAVTMSIKDGSIKVFTEFPHKPEKALVGTWESHAKNMVKGVTDGYEYTMKLVYSHFPVKMSVKGETFVIDNFLGEKCPRKARIMYDTKVVVKGDNVIITGINKEHVGQTSANIELATKIKRYDPRVFQDGIYIVEKRC